MGEARIGLRRRKEVLKIVRCFTKYEKDWRKDHDNVGFNYNCLDLMQNPFVSDLISQAHLEKISSEQLEEIETRLPEWIEDLADKMRVDCITTIVCAREEAGLKPFDSYHASEAASDSMTDSVLDSASTIFEHGQYEFHTRRSKSYSQVCREHGHGSYSNRTPYNSSPYSRNIHNRMKAWIKPEVNKRLLLLSEQAMESLEVPLNATMGYMDGLASSLECSNCSFKQFQSWILAVCINIRLFSY